LERAHLAGVDVAVVECKTFDELAADVVNAVKLPSPLHEHVFYQGSESRLVPVNVPVAEARNFPVLRYSALRIEELPRIARRLTLQRPATSPEVRALLKEHRCRAVVAATGREVAAFGRDEEIVAALATLGAQIAGTVNLEPTRDSWALGLLYDALVRALSRRRPLIPRFKRSGHSLVIAAPREGEDAELARRRAQDLARLRAAYESSLTGTVPKLQLPYQEGVFLKLDRIEDRWWCGFEPYTFVEVPKTPPSIGGVQERDELGRPMERRGGDPAGDWRRERWAQKFNKHWAGIVDAWAALLTSTQDGPVRAFGLQGNEGIDAEFAVSPVTGWSRPAHHHTYFERTR
jgi:hypothetical protein